MPAKAMLRNARMRESTHANVAGHFFVNENIPNHEKISKML
jgi:hypothetical protein